MAVAMAEAPASYAMRDEPMESMMAQQSMPSLSSMPTASPFTAEMNDFDTRPDFIDAAALRRQYPCPLCTEILTNPQQTPCGGRACKVCLRNKFGQEETIRCPMPHDEEEDMEDGSLEECQRDGGLKKNDISPDSAVQRVLLKRKCHCRNRKYGCKDTPIWRKLPLHEHECRYSPVRCSRGDCKELFPEMEREHHDKEVCRFVNVSCEFCKRVLLRGALDDHIDTCDRVNSSCESCRKDFGYLKRLRLHHQISPTCNKRTGRCHYYECCQFTSKNPEQMKAHLRDSADLHMEYLTMKSADLEVETKKTQETYKEEATGMLNKKVKPLEKAAANIYMEVKILQKKIDSSDTNSDHLVNAMNTVSNNSTQVESLTNKIGIIERQIKDSGLDRVMVIDSHSQNIRRHTDKLSDLETRMKNTEVGSYDGTFIWKIKDYKVRKADAVRGRQMSIYSPPFYSSKFGYKMCCRAYLNGDGLGRNKCLSLFFVLMRGDFDELIQFPFQQRVTFSLLCPTNSSLSKHESFMPDPDSTSFRRPQTEMNIASGCPQFALQSDVESSAFLINNCIYIRIRVAEGGDKIQ